MVLLHLEIFLEDAGVLITLYFYNFNKLEFIMLSNFDGNHC